MKAETPTVLAESDYDWEETTPSQALLEALAVVENVPTSSLLEILDRPLYGYIDPDALDSLVTGSNGVTVSMMIDSYRVVIDGDRLVVRK